MDVFGKLWEFILNECRKGTETTLGITGIMFKTDTHDCMKDNPATKNNSIPPPRKNKTTTATATKTQTGLN